MIRWTLLKLRFGSPATRSQAVKKLGESHSVRAIKWLTSVHGELLYREEARESLLTIQKHVGETAFVAELARLMEHKDRDRRTDAAKFFEWFSRNHQSTRAVDGALAAAVQSTDDIVREMAARYWAKRCRDCRPPAEIPAVLTGALRDTSCEVRRCAAIALGYLRDSAHNDSLTNAVNSLVAALADPHYPVRMAVGQTLKKLGWQPTDIGQQIHLAIADGDYKSAAAKGRDAVPALIDAFECKFDGQDNLDCPAIAAALATTGDERAVVSLSAKLLTENDKLAAAVGAALHPFAHERVVEQQLYTALTDKSFSIQLRAIRQLGRLGIVSREAVKRLLQQMWQKELVQAASHALLTLGPRVLRTLIGLARDPEVAEQSIHAIEIVLGGTRREATSEDLRVAAELDNINQRRTIGARYGYGNEEEICKVDCTQARLLAREELERRGESAELD